MWTKYWGLETEFGFSGIGLSQKSGTPHPNASSTSTSNRERRCGVIEESFFNDGKNQSSKNG